MSAGDLTSTISLVVGSVSAIVAFTQSLLKEEIFKKFFRKLSVRRSILGGFAFIVSIGTIVVAESVLKLVMARVDSKEKPSPLPDSVWYYSRSAMLVLAVLVTVIPLLQSRVLRNLRLAEKKRKKKRKKRKKMKKISLGLSGPDKKSPQ